MSKAPQRNELRRIIRIKDLVKMIGVSRSSVYDRLSKTSPRYDAQFPTPVRLGMNTVGWFVDEIEAWLSIKGALRNDA